MTACGAATGPRHWPLEPGVLTREVSATGDRYSRLLRLLGGDTSAYAALTAGDLLYDAFRINPTAIEGIDFARAADLSDILGFSRFATDLSGLDPAALAGNLAQLHGYVAERVAAAALRAEGAEVEFPSASSEPGWDLLVNGERFQVKCLASPGGVHEHLARFPDIPVITNVELADSFANDSRVIPLTGLSHSEVVATTRETLDAGADLLDLEIPLIAGAVAAARAGLALLRRESDLLSALIAVSIRAGGGMAGGAGGATATTAGLGVLGATGGWIAIIAPAFGSIAGFRGGGLMADRLRRGLLCREEADALLSSLREFAGSAVVVLERMIASSIRFRELLRRMAPAETSFGRALQEDWLWRVDREIDHRRFYLRRLARAARDPWSIDRRLRDLRAVAATMMSTAAHGGVVRANLKTPLDRLDAAVERYDRAAKRWLIG